MPVESPALMEALTRAGVTVDNPGRIVSISCSPHYHYSGHPGDRRLEKTTWTVELELED